MQLATPQLALNRIVDQIPSQHKKIVSVSSATPDQIIERLVKIDSHDIVVLNNGDVWRYGNNSALLDFFSSRPNTKFLIQHIGYHYQQTAANVWEFPVPFSYPTNVDQQCPIKSPNISHGFACLNNRQKLHRLLLGYQLWKHNLLDHVIYSQNLIPKINGTYIWGHVEFLLKQLPDMDKFLTSLPRQWKEPQSDFAKNHEFNGHDAYDQAFSFIVTETETEFRGVDFRYPSPGVTEKTFKPALSAQVPIYLAAPGHMKFLKSHGLETFDDLVPAAYDQWNTEEKISAIIDIVLQGRDYIKQFYFDHIREIKYNHHRISSGGFENSIVNTACNFIESETDQWKHDLQR